MGDTPAENGGPSRTIERILAEAATDQEFCEHLLRDRVEAVEQRGYALDDNEKAMLRAVPENQLRAILEKIAGSDLHPEQVPFDQEQMRYLPCEGIRPKGPRRLLLTAAVTTAALGGGAALLVTAGNRPDAEPQPRAEQVESPTPDAGPDSGGKTED